MRGSIDCSSLNRPRLIAGIDYKIVVGVLMFFGYAAAEYRSPGVMAIPLLFLLFIRGPAKKDPAMLKVYLRHRAQAERYSPAYITAKNYHAPRPDGFNRYMSV